MDLRHIFTAQITNIVSKYVKLLNRHDNFVVFSIAWYDMSSLYYLNLAFTITDVTSIFTLIIMHDNFVRYCQIEYNEINDACYRRSFHSAEARCISQDNIFYRGLISLLLISH